jgi:hypothetical protein
MKNCRRRLSLSCPNRQVFFDSAFSRMYSISLNDSTRIKGIEIVHGTKFTYFAYNPICVYPTSYASGRSNPRGAIVVYLWDNNMLYFVVTQYNSCTKQLFIAFSSSIAYFTANQENKI